jgi:vacuolar-type H+-ATPase subunit H
MEGFMGLTRKRKRELIRLKEHAEDLWGDQKEVLEHATQVVREASRQASNYAREEVTPRVRDTLDHNVKPAVATGIAATKSAVSTTRDKITDDVVPAVTTAFGTALASIEAVKDERLREALKTVHSAGDKVGKQVSQASDTLSKNVSKTSDKLGKNVSKAGAKVSGKAAKVSAKATKLAQKSGIVKKSPGPGRYILIGVIVVAIAGIAYAAWQTLRADDDLWIDEDETPDQERSTSVDDTV